MADNILQVKDLKISFRTVSGTVKAVRDISFNLERGETLAIVGESGSGKSVTSKAILGILAGNSIVESGEILYDGKDLLKISEDDMHKIRGDKISMIFQDPLSSLDPIVKIGKQITEAMLLKNKANRRASRKEFNEMLAELKKHMEAAVGERDRGALEEIRGLIKTFDSFNIEAIRLENDYSVARTHAEELIADIDDFLFRVEHRQRLDVRSKLVAFGKKIGFVKDTFLTADYDSRLAETGVRIKEQIALLGDRFESMRVVARKVSGKEHNIVVPESVVALLHQTKALLEEIISQARPNFFRIGFCKLHGEDVSLSGRSVDQLNEFALQYLNEHFMNRFMELAVLGLEHSRKSAVEGKKQVIELSDRVHAVFSSHDFEKKQATELCKELSDVVEKSIDRLEPIKDSLAYTFPTSFRNAINRYFYYKKKNPKEEARFDRQTRKREALIARGKKVDWKVVPKVVMDLDEEIKNICSIYDRLKEKYVEDIGLSLDFKKKCIELVDFFKDKASQVVYVVTKRIAHEKAIKLMEEVGIPEPRIRYYQYPFEFSGGMRQRIVIAIALAANPDILICDEPTTALDVTIQAQILELINKLKRERNLSVIFITHDLGVVANMADKIAVMYAGKIVEYGTADDIFYDPRHPYTWALLSSMPDLDTDEKLDAIPGTPPNMIYPPQGDAFAERNKYALKIDFEEQPPMFSVSDTHWAATWLLHPDAPKVPTPKAITDRIARMKRMVGGEDGK